MVSGECKRRGPQSGFTYLGMLALLTVMLMWAGAAVEVTHTQTRREQEEELLFVGQQYRTAIQGFQTAMGRLPGSLEEMLQVSLPAGPPKRFLRRIYPDPISGEMTWGVVTGPGGGIQGVYSRSELKPLKQTGFEKENMTFSGALTYSDWKFTAQMMTGTPTAPAYRF
jgi:type II secretory pathway pseudopilin PulG